MKYLVLSLLLLSGCSNYNVDTVKLHARETFEANGFTVVGYQGYQYTLLGGCVWYTLKQDTILYKGCITAWDDELHIYNLKALNAVSNTNYR